MAGYIMSINKDGLKKVNNRVKTSEIEIRLNDIISTGVYSTRLTPPSFVKSWNKNMWSIHHLATFGDYVSMKPGDNIYFFIDRKIYGIGTLKDIEGDCKFKNYKLSNIPDNHSYSSIEKNMLYKKDENPNYRWICTFEPSPHFYKIGVDMDEALLSSPNSFRMLRAFWGRSFIKIDDEENKALKDIILKKNENYINYTNNNNIFNYTSLLHRLLKKKLGTSKNDYQLNPLEIVNQTIDSEKVRYEMSLEVYLLHKLNKINKEPCILGKWDYLSHQVIASPHKPIDYMDKIDIFGYKYLNNHNTITRYLVTEVKAGIATSEDIDQLMKYVDWISQEYAHGDYSMIEANLVAFEFSENVIQHSIKVGKRQFIKGSRPAIPTQWNCVKLIKYSHNGYDIKLTNVKQNSIINNHDISK